MPSLFSYCIRYDGGAAPNPFWGICSLVICKPVIRRIANVGDWIVATGSKHSPIGDCSGQVVYTMKVTRVMSMREYDDFTKAYLHEKIPEYKNPDVRRRLGDSIYDYRVNPPRLRRSVHNEKYRKRDLGGINALLSECFYYFGDQPIPLPEHLITIVKQGQGHRSRSNAPYLLDFIEWIETLGLDVNTLYGNPQLKLFDDEFP